MGSEHAKHTATRRGNLVRVELENGEKFYDRFLDRKGHRVVEFQQRGKIDVARIKTFIPVGTNEASVEAYHARREYAPVLKERVEIKPVEKPTFNEHPLGRENQLAPLPAPQYLALKGAYELKNEILGMTPFVVQLLDTGYVMTLHFTNVLGLAKAKKLLGINELAQVDDFKPKVQQRGLGLKRKVVGPRPDRVCSFCGTLYKPGINRPSASGKYKCGSVDCAKAYMRWHMKNRRAYSNT